MTDMVTELTRPVDRAQLDQEIEDFNLTYPVNVDEAVNLFSLPPVAGTGTAPATTTTQPVTTATQTRPVTSTRTRPVTNEKMLKKKREAPQPPPADRVPWRPPEHSFKLLTDKDMWKIPSKAKEKKMKRRVADYKREYRASGTRDSYNMWLVKKGYAKKASTNCILM